MRYLWGIILMTCAVMSFYYVGRIVANKQLKNIAYRVGALASLASGLWSVGYGVMQFTDSLLLYQIFRIVGLMGIVLFMIFGQLSIGFLTDDMKKLRPFIVAESVVGFGVIVMMAIPKTYTIEITEHGIVTGFASAAISIIYTAYCLVIAASFVTVTIRMKDKKHPMRVRSIGTALLRVEAVIGIGMVIDTILPAVGINLNIPASSMLQFVGLMIFRAAILRYSKDTISIENMTGYIYQSFNSPVLVFDANHRLCLANDTARAVFDIPAGKEIDRDYDFWMSCFEKRREDYVMLSDSNMTMTGYYPSKDMHFNITVAPIMDSYQEFIGYIVMAMDVTEQVKSVDAVNEAKHDAEMAMLEAEHANELAEVADRTNRTKSDFLANMSHEIRTPMNAIIGMAEMSLRTELPQEARGYVSQIKSSGVALLSIINDILDFSKIEAGKMDIIPDEFEVLSNIQDVGAILMTRIQDKDIELLTSIEPTIPYRLYGDNQRIRQVLINLANNAIKFTKQGFVRVNMTYEVLDEEHIMLRFDVQDSGIGIKEEDLKKLFESFSQVDTKRNRAVEGTGLGLAISKKLVELMGGDLSVKSEYGVGSEFSFRVPLKVIDWKPCIEVPEKDNIVAIGYFGKKCLARQFFTDIKMLGVDSIAIGNIANYSEGRRYYQEDVAGKRKIFFTEASVYDNELTAFADEHPEMDFVVLRSFATNKKSEKSNVRFAKKPLSTLLVAMTLNNDDSGIRREETVLDFDFIAPKAKILIVDDNEVNLSVAEGLLQPLEMTIRTATGGKKALDCLQEEKFDLVFMDHMMPELDGVETTRIIRRLHPELKDMPIIALTANAVGEAKQMFLSEGMDDFVAKPIEVRTIVSKVRQWLPESMIEKGRAKTVETTGETTLETTAEEELPVIGDLDIEAALKLIGSRTIYFTILEKYYKAIGTKADIIRNAEKTENIDTYTIEVHALKSSSKQIGAMELSAAAAELEKAGKEKNLAAIHADTAALLEKYLSYEPVIRPFVKVQEDAAEDTVELNIEELKELMDRLKAACDELDMDGMEAITKEMGRFSFDSENAEFFARVQEHVAGLDSFSCVDVLNEWEGYL